MLVFPSKYVSIIHKPLNIFNDVYKIWDNLHKIHYQYKTFTFRATKHFQLVQKPSVLKIQTFSVFSEMLCWILIKRFPELKRGNEGSAALRRNMEYAFTNLQA